MRFFILILLSFIHLKAIAGSVLILDDEYGDEVSQYLQSAGHTVTSVTYFEWDGTNPAPSDFDLVLLLNGDSYGYDFDEDGDSPAYDILIDYVKSGGTFMFTEWTAYDMAYVDPSHKQRLEPLVPFNIESYVDYDYGGTFTTSVASALTRGVPASFDAKDDADGGACIALKAGARVLMTRDFDYYSSEATECDLGGGHPGLVVHGVGQGTVVWFNSDLNHEDDYDAGPNHLKIIASSVGYAVRADTILNPPLVPTLPLLGVGILASLLGLLGLRLLRS
jgi:hypothetical protein